MAYFKLAPDYSDLYKGIIISSKNYYLLLVIYISKNQSRLGLCSQVSSTLQ